MWQWRKTFSILKTEYIYRHKPATFSEVTQMIGRCIHFSSYERILSGLQLSQGLSKLWKSIYR